MDIFKLVGSIFVDTEEANKSLSKTGDNAEKTSGKLGNIAATAGKVALGVGAATATGAAALMGMAKKAAETTDEIDKMSQRLGISRESYQELDFVLSQSGVDINSFQTGMKSLLKNMDAVTEGNKTAIENFDKLGIAVQNTDGTMRSQEEVLFETIQAFQGMEDSAEKSRLAQELFGKQGQEILPLLNSEAGSLEEMRQQAQDLGLVLSDDTINAGVQFTDTMDQVQRSLLSVVTQIGVEVMPVIMELLDWIEENMPQIQAVMQVVFDVLGEAINVLGQLIGWLFDVFKQNFPAIKEIVLTVFNTIINFWKNNLKPMFEAIINFIQTVLYPAFELVFKHLISPIIEAWYKLFVDLWNDTLKPVLTNIIDFITNVFTGNFSGAFENLVNIVKAIWNGIIDVVKTPVNEVIGIINSFMDGIIRGVNSVIDALNRLKIDVPDWVTKLTGITSFGFNIPSVPSGLKIPLLAEGGDIVESGSAIVGEAGAELIDLPQGARVTPLTNNGDPLGYEALQNTMNDLLEQVADLNNDLESKIVMALNNLNIDWNDRELGRLVQKYA